jgi:hypothetical protein
MECIVAVLSVVFDAAHDSLGCLDIRASPGGHGHVEKTAVQVGWPYSRDRADLGWFLSACTSP